MRNLITEKEYEIMDFYRQYYASPSDTEETEYTMTGTFNSSYNILSEWENAKSSFLFKLLGNQLMISKRVTFEESWEEHENEIEKLYQMPFMNRVQKFFNNLYQTDTDAFFSDFNCNMKGILNPDYITIWTNKINFNPRDYAPIDNNGKIVVFRQGDKWIRAVGKIVKLMGWPQDEFEDFRNAHSRMIQNKKTSGILTLSIHPMDYMTMSDNCGNWTSCMSWSDHGCYRHGTVEMMNSPCVLVAYLASENKNLHLARNLEWNSKKYRQLVIVDSKFITTVRPYPNENTCLDEEIMSWVRELMNKNINSDLTWSKTYSYNPNRYCAYDWQKDKIITDDEYVKTFRIMFNTNNMYNDFCHRTHKICVSNYGAEYSKDNGVIDWCYSGASQCMWCGELNPHLESEEDLCGTECYQEAEYYYCEHCRSTYLEDEIILTADGYYYCHHCYDKYCVETSNPEWEYKYQYIDMRHVFVIDDEGNLITDPDNKNSYAICLFGHDDFYNNFQEKCNKINAHYTMADIYYIIESKAYELGLIPKFVQTEDIIMPCWDDDIRTVQERIKEVFI